MTLPPPLPVVIINMEKSTDRLEKITENMNDIGLKFTRFNAINGNQLTDQEVNDNTTFMCRNLLCSRSVIGCALSHITVWKNFLDNQYGTSDILCVMEDDISISGDFPEFLNDIPSIRESLDFDMMRINCGTGNMTGEKINMGKYKFIKNPVIPLSLACYIITRKGAQKALEILGESVPYIIDFSLGVGMLFNNMSYLILVNPELVTLSLANPSTINSNGTKGIMSIFKDGNLNWYLNIPVASISTRYDISLYTCILLVLLIIGIYRKWYIFSVIVLAELIMVNF
jgi:GR25 family glycosyltransferase involved in LPS biosynthesis